MVHTGLTTPLALFTAAVTMGLAIVAWRNRPRPGALPFTGLMVAITYFSVVTPVWARTSHSGATPEALIVATLSMVTVMPLLWLLFVLEYAGYREYLGRYALTMLAVPPALFVAVMVSPYRDLFTVGSQHPIRGLYPVFLLGYTGIGILLLGRFVVSERRLYTDQSVALVVGVLAPIVGAYLGEANIMLMGFTVTGLAFGFALFRFDLFTLLPVTRRLGRENAIEDLGEGVFIFDPDGTIVDLNRSAAGIVGRSRGDLLGGSLHTVLDTQAFVDDRLVPPTFETDDGRIYDVSISPMHDRLDRVVGHTVVFRDITNRKLRETQLEVLNRVLRHNLRNKLSVVQVHAELLADEDTDDASDVLERHMAATADLMALGERAREFERLKTRDQVTPRPVELAKVVKELVDGVVEEFPEADVTTEVPAGLTVKTYPDALEIALENLLRNAAEHTNEERPHIEVTAAEDGDAVAISVRDDGPGIPEHELSVLEADAESALEHGSGLGLWITKWAVQYLAGDLTFESNDSRGTTATVILPISASAQGANSLEPTPSN